MQLYKHQQSLLNINPKKYGLFWTCGAGKTLMALELIKKNNATALIICPKAIRHQWENQTNDKVITKEEFRRDWSKLPYYDCCVLDEIHFFLGMHGLKKKSGMLKAILGYIKKYNPEYIYGLTATPYLSSPLNIYALSDIFGKKWDYKKYHNIFFTKVNMGRRYLVPVVNKTVQWRGKKVNTEDAISDLVSVLGNAVALSDCVDVPDQIYQTEYFDLTAEQKKAIKELNDTNHIVFWTKCHQVCGGSLKSDGYSENKFYKSEKLDRVLQLVQEHKKLIIICRYNNEIDYIKIQIRKKTSKQIFIINGATKNRHDIIKSADRRDEAIVIVNAACSEGYELPSFPIMVFYSYDFSLKNFIQMRGRIQRINRIKKNVYLSLVVKKSIDADVYKSIQRKEDFQIAIYKNPVESEKIKKKKQIKRKEKEWLSNKINETYSIINKYKQ